MFLGRVRGTVVTSVMTPDLEGMTLRIVQPVNHDQTNAGPLIVAVDSMGVRDGDFVYLVKGKEAMIPLKRTMACTDAAIVGRIEGMDLR